MGAIYENIKEQNRGKEHKMLLAFDGMIADVLNSNQFNSVVTESFIRCIKLNIAFVFTTQSNFL